MKLQKFDHRSSSWERPTEAWRCGRAAEGAPCRLGPDLKGKCQATHECEPRLNGETWECTKSTTMGEPCDGPLPDGTCSRPLVPCSPVRSWRERRKTFSRSVVFGTVAFLAIVIGGWRVGTTISPRPLIPGHAAVSDCASCHSRFLEGPAGWVAFPMRQGGTRNVLCVKCHALDVEPSSPHGLESAELATLTEARTSEAEERVQLRRRLGIIPEAGELACASCHAEHQGREADLTRVPNDRCQTCHRAAFRSLVDGHPEFGTYPFRRRARIAFDHAAHFSRNFDEAGREKAPKGCTGCHVADTAGRSMLHRPFEETCANCHRGQISGDDRPAGTKGVELLAVPGLDVETIFDRGFDIGEWPDWSEREIPPFMEILLRADPGTAADLVALDGVDLLDLEDEDDAVIEAAARLAWRVKEMFETVRASGPVVLGADVETAAGGAIPRETMAALFASMPRDVIVAAQQDWFPALDADLARHRAGAPLRPRRPKVKKVVPVPAAPAGTSPGDDLLSGGDDLLSGDDDLLSGSDDLLSGDDDLLSGGDDDLLTGDDDLLSGGDDDLLSGAPSTTPSTEPAVQAPEPTEELGGESWAALGGWFRDDYAIFYRPVAHRDPFLGAWMNLVAGIDGGRPGARALERLRAKTAPGACGKCHSVDTLPDGKSVVNWKPGISGFEMVSFTRFAHAPHFSITKSDCSDCHPPSNASGFATTYEQGDPHDYVRGFDPTERKVCVRCHDGRAATDLCTSCHNYHVTRNTVRAAPPTIVEEVQDEQDVQEGQNGRAGQEEL